MPIDADFLPALMGIFLKRMQVWMAKPSYSEVDDLQITVTYMRRKVRHVTNCAGEKGVQLST